MERIESTAIQKMMSLILAVSTLAALCLASLYSYLLFHSLSEILSIVVAWGIFIVAWNSRRFIESNYLLFLGVAYLFIGGIDLTHTLAYKGMGIFSGYGPNLPTQLWIVARYMECITLFIAPLLIHKSIRTAHVFIAYLAAASLSLLAIFAWGVFPDCYIEGQGLTLFKKISEYIISLVLIGSIVLLHRRRHDFDPGVFKLIVASIIISIGAELAFTFYVSVFALSNLIGHLFKLISFYIIYKAIIETGLVRPYDLMFRNLKKSEEKLRKERDGLQHALDEIRMLEGFLPICSNCKKIRNDEGNWTQLEKYIKDHSEAEFTHGICPECAKKLYPDIKKEDRS